MNKKSNSFEKRKKIIIFVSIGLILAIIIAIILILLNDNQYKKIEKKMVENAQKIVADKKLTIENQEYIFLDDLDVADDTVYCSKASGVLITKVRNSIEYKAYLNCLNYESKILNNRDKYLKLKGNSVELVNKGTLYFDPGYETLQDVEVKSVGVVNSGEGAYTINYVVTQNGKQKDIVKRVVIVSPYDTYITANEIKDLNLPIINLLGEQEVFVKKGDNYVEPGYTAYDYEDGKITNKVQVDNKININDVGTYEITYSVKNSKDKVYSTVRKVNIVDKIGDVDIMLTTKSVGEATNKVIIDAFISGNCKTYELPTSKKEVPCGIINNETFEVTEAGLYVVKATDQYDNVITKSILVSSIDKNKPTGTCELRFNDPYTEIFVTAQDDRGVNSINYVINGNESGFMESTTYKTKDTIKTISAIIRDVSGNMTQVKCGKNNSSITSSIYTFKYNNNNKNLMSCNTYTSSERTALESKLKSAVDFVDANSRAGAVEAARFLIGGLDYKIPYSSSTYNKIGLNLGNTNAWGCKNQGLNELGLLEWIFINGGIPKETYAQFLELSDSRGIKDIMDKLQVGDLLLQKDDNNVGIIIGITNDKFYVATSRTDKGVFVIEIAKNELDNNKEFDSAKILKYPAEGNVTTIW